MAETTGPTCSAESGCARPVLARGWCSTHYKAWHRENGPSPQVRKRCKVDRCTALNYGRGYCRPHLRAWQKFGDPLGAAAPWRGQPCSVDGCDEPNNSKGLCTRHVAQLRTRGYVGGAAKEKGLGLVHGTPNGYKHHGCRCDDCRDARRRYEIGYRSRNRDAVRAGLRRRREANPEKMAEYRRAWAMRNPDKVTKWNPVRGVAKFDDEAIAYAELIRRDPCVYCGGATQEIDHVVPVSTSRSSDWMNLAPTCSSCNRSKGAKSVLAYLIYRQEAPES